MKQTFVLLFLAFLIGCRSNDAVPDVSGVKADVNLKRFDQDLFALDTNNLATGLNGLYQEYPELTPIFLEQILGVDQVTAVEGVKQFLRMSGSIRNAVNDVFENTDDLKKEFEQAFKFVKHYFPDYTIPKVITIVGPVDALAQGSNGPTPNFIRPEFLGISLQFYLGRDFPVYQDPFFVENVAPLYRSRRFSKEYITTDAMQLVVDNLFQDKSQDKSLIEQMIEKGKRWWLLDKFLPHTPDSIKTGYTQQQLQWCRDNEGLIWTYISKQEDLYSINQATIQTYIGEGPFTQGFSQELSPGNIGQWLGWQIVRKFVSKSPGMKLEEVMNASAKEILEGAKYKPK